MFSGHAISRLDGSPSDGIHLIWSPPGRAGYSVKGIDIWRRAHRGERGFSCYELGGAEHDALERFLSVTVPRARVSLVLGVLFSAPTTLPDEPYREGRGISPVFHVSSEGRVTWRPASVALRPEAVKAVFGRERPAWRDRAEDGAARVYHIDFDVPCAQARVRAVGEMVLAVALREGKAVDARALDPGEVEVAFARPLDRISLYALGPIGRLRICRDAEKEGGWDWALIAEGVQVPFAAANGSLGGLDDERDLVNARRLPGEPEVGPEFKDLSLTANHVLKHDKMAPPTMFSLLTRQSPGDAPVELQPWRYLMAMTLDAPWRRSLGFGFLDVRDGLAPGEVYDYRIVAHVRARDASETFLSFHTVPLDAALPASFRLGPVGFDLPSGARIGAWPVPPAGAVRHLCRKGLWIEGECILDFAEPISRLVLEFEPEADHALWFDAETTSFIPGLPMAIDQGPVPAQARVALAFSGPVDRVRLGGKALLYGLRLPALPAGVDPDKLVTVVTEIDAIRFERTEPPPAPSFLGTVNLQLPPSFDPPSGTPHPAPNPLGFRLSWLPPPIYGFATESWPQDIASAPPSEVAGYVLERRRVDEGGSFRPFDRDHTFDGDTLLTGGRGAPYQPETIVPGSDLLLVYPEAPAPVPPIPIFAEIEDVLTSPARPKGPPPGSLHQYRIASVDMIGRRSDDPREGAVVRLEKRVPPPRPPGPPLPPLPDPPPAGPATARPKGVSARAIQAGDSALSDADADRLAGHANAVVLQWGWTADERRQDPFATEFRIYRRDDLPDEIRCELVGPLGTVGDRYRLHAHLTRPVEADRFAGQYVDAGGYPFRIATHGAGTDIAIDFEPSALEPGRKPAQGRFTIAIPPRGGDLRPAAWTERVQVVPITAESGYEFVFHDHFAVGPATPKTRGWVGVSAADDQTYIPDEIGPARPWGDRPGNESSVVPAVFAARYVGQPVFVVPPPLPDVPEILLPDLDGAAVAHSLDLPGLLPGIPRPAGHRLQVERASGADLFAVMSARADGAVGVRLPDGSSDAFVHANPGDQSELLAGIRSGEPGRIANKFLLDLAIRFEARLAPLWLPVATVEIDARAADTVANKAERHLYRVRLVDEAGHRSAGSAIVPRVFRVPSRRLPGAPHAFRTAVEEDTVAVEAVLDEHYDLGGLLVFSLVLPRNAALAPERLHKADLLRLRNRFDLPPAEGVRVRLRDGTLLAPAFVPRAAAIVDGRQLRFHHEVAAGFEARVLVWAAIVTRDRVPSLLLGPEAALTAAAPPAVPSLSLTVDGADRLAAWPPSAAVNVRVERGGGAAWDAVSPWLPGTLGQHRLLGAAGTAGSYRLRVRAATGREATGPAVGV